MTTEWKCKVCGRTGRPTPTKYNWDGKGWVPRRPVLCTDSACRNFNLPIPDDELEAVE